MHLTDTHRNPGQSRGQNSKNISAKGMRMNNISSVLSEELRKLPDGHGTPMSLAGHEVSVHSKFSQFVEENAFDLVGHDMNFVVFRKQWKQGA